jgi:hypothetical protein
MNPVDPDTFTLSELEQLLEDKKKATTLTFPDVNSKGQGLPTPANTQTLLCFYKITIRYNEMTKDTDIDIPGVNFSVDTAVNAKLEYIKGLARHHRLNPSDLFGHLTVVANQNSYHPVRDWIDQQVCNRDFSKSVFTERSFSFRHPVHKTVIAAVIPLQHLAYSTRSNCVMECNVH